MAVNTSHAPTDGPAQGAHSGVVIYNGEHIMTFVKIVNLSVSAKQSQSNGALFKGTKKGALYLTTHRIIFRNKNSKDAMQSFCMPFCCMRDVKLEQPILGANYLQVILQIIRPSKWDRLAQCQHCNSCHNLTQGGVVAMPNGNWEGEGTFKLTFDHGGCIDFGQVLLKAVDIASRFSMYTSPPPYSQPTGGVFNPPPDYYWSSNGNYQGFQAPMNAFPDAPNPNDVYMYEAPPPYPGVVEPAPPPFNPQSNANEAPPYPVQRSGATRAQPPPYPMG